MSDLRIAGLRKAYARGGRGAVDGIDLDVRDGEVMALLGPSGCGKTTTLQLVAGFLTPDEGEIWTGGRCLSKPGNVVPPERRGMSLVFQSYAVWPHMTVRENVAFGLRLQGANGRALRERVDALLAIVRLGEFAERYPAELSGGQQQRVALARAVAVKPAILLLDEPLSNLDPALRDEMRIEIRRLHEETGVTMLYVTHDRNEAMVAADRIAVLNHGRVEQCGTPADLFERPKTAFVAEFIGRANVLPGVVLEPGVIAFGGTTLRAAHGDFASGSSVALCVQPHRVELGDAPNGQTLLGRIVRHTYLGDCRDYAIELEGGMRVRATRPPTEDFAQGSEVHVTLAPDACYIVGRSDERTEIAS